MESILASSSVLPSALPAGEYEVFLSFRGPDVRKTFADHLYTSLYRSKIRTFRDEEELCKGEGIAPSLVQAIPNSKIYIPILTKQYASSKWCLQELAQMVGCWKQKKGHLILPIFYFVDPRDVRHQHGSYQEAFVQHAQKHSPETVNEWKEALQEVGQMKGWHVTESDSQGAIIEQILSEVELHLRGIYTLVTDELVGIDSHVEEVMTLLNSSSSIGKVVGIHGMGGLGKTTLSKAVYNKICTQFERFCFLEDVRETLTNSEGALSLQNKLISSILKKDYHQVSNVSEGINMIKERVCKHKVLIVIDDIDGRFEFDKIIGSLGDFSFDSRFMFTTSLMKLDEGNHFWMHDHIKDLGRAIVREEDIQHPYNRSRIWSTDDALDMLRNTKGTERVEVLRVDVKSREHEKELKSVDFKDLSGLRYLEVRYGSIMGDFSQVLPNLCCLRLPHCDSIPSDIYMKKLVVLDLKECNVKDNWRGWNRIKAAAKLKAVNLPQCSRLRKAPDLSTCTSLEFINFGSCRHMEGELHIGTFKNLKRLSLRWTNITELIIRGNDIGKFRRLEELDLTSTCLRELPAGMENLPSLKSLLLESGKSWEFLMKEIPRLPRSIKRLTISPPSTVPNLLELTELESLSYLRGNIPCIPEDLWLLCDYIETLVISYSPNLINLHGLENLIFLKNLYVGTCSALERLPSVMNLIKLKLLVVYECPVLVEIQGLGGLGESLSRLLIGGCPSLANYDGLQLLGALEYLTFQEQSFCLHGKESFPDLSGLFNLKQLKLRCCLELTELTGFERLMSLERFTMKECNSIRNLPDLSGHGNLKTLNIRFCDSLINLTGIERLESLREIEIHDCNSITKLPNLSGLKNLELLNLSKCTALTEVQGVEGLESLTILQMGNCRSIKALGNLSGLKKLELLDIEGCTKLTKVNGLEELDGLRYMDMGKRMRVKYLAKSAARYGKGLLSGSLSNW
ncbi:unnamed protein product [Linum tenue]|uniref:TIR domain-containing protein n=1 Tax=Linum tenue TaxID=586396 RepID=A0AAV0MGU6_9ROSI|nr:unnamed protein product [Linum tenue]